MTQRRNHFHHLKKAWLKRHAELKENLWEKHKDSLDWLQTSSKQMAIGSMTGLLMLHQPPLPVPLTSTLVQTLHPSTEHILENSIDSTTQLLSELSFILPKVVEPLTPEQEKAVGDLLSERFHMNVSAELKGIRLNRSYGYIGAEQHLMRYPGDTILSHFQNPEEFIFAASGMAPGRGAWGYFAPSQAEMTQQDIEREKYYIAVQTFLAPGWSDHVREYYAFFKYHKMLVVNPDNGKAMIVVIGDAGPSPFTGKHLGGSPEVMKYLDRKDGAQKGPVLYFFIDDPDDKIPLGPISPETYETLSKKPVL